jgi:hypothetical protein
MRTVRILLHTFCLYVGALDPTGSAKELALQANVAGKFTLHRVVSKQSKDHGDHKNWFAVERIPCPNSVPLTLSEFRRIWKGQNLGCVSDVGTCSSCSTIPSNISRGGAMLEVERKCILNSFWDSVRGSPAGVNKKLLCSFHFLDKLPDVSSQYIQIRNASVL